ncbi:MAG: DUF1189 family protein [Parcubacteria group bacterium]|jgi:hypothetical protein
MKKIMYRFVDVWKVDFLTKFFAGEHRNTCTTISFWVLSNVVIVFVLSVQMFVFLYASKSVVIDGVQNAIGDGATITFLDGQMTTENIDDPFFREIKTTNANGQSVTSVVIIDMHADTYDLDALDEYAGGVIALHDRMYIKDGNDITQMLYTNVRNFSLSKEQVLAYIDRYYAVPFVLLATVIVGVVLLLTMMIGRTIAALWWALMLYMIGLIMNVRMAYDIAFKSVLNLYFVPMSVVVLLGIINIQIPLLTTVIFIAMFVANLIWLKRHVEPEKADTSDVVVTKTQEEAEEAVATSPEKM